MVGKAAREYPKTEELREAAKAAFRWQGICYGAFTKKELQDLGVTKIPSSNKIQKRIENLESELAATIREKQELQKKQKTLAIIRQNFTNLLDNINVNSNLLQEKNFNITER